MNTPSDPIPFSVETIRELAQRRQGAVVWLDDHGVRDWAQFGRAVEVVWQRCASVGAVAGEVIILPGEASFETLAWLFGAAALGLIVAPLRRERWSELQGWKEFIHIDWLVQHDRLERVGAGSSSPIAAALLEELSLRQHPGLILATGGTTGAPKVLLHDLRALLATVSVREGRPRRILPLMRFDHIGGLDMAWRALAGGQVLVAPPLDLAPDAIAATIARHQIEVLPATPSLLNMLLITEATLKHDLSSLRVVPYGAEPMPGGLLERLQLALPQVQFVQRFGTSETGALPVQSSGDGLKLSAAVDGFAWKVVAGELWIKSPARALGYLSGDGRKFAEAGWFQTGDLAEVLSDGTLRVLGRRDELINVGGEKVLPAGVESVLLTHPAVIDCRVMAVPNAVLGQVVGAEIIWRGEERDPIAVKRLLLAHVGGRLPRFHLPTVVRLVESIATTRNFKKSRVNP